MYDDGEAVGYKLMDMNGDVHYSKMDNAIWIGENDGYVNAKILYKDGSGEPYISALRGKFKNFEVKVDVEDMKYYNSSYSTDINSACPPDVTGGATTSNINVVNTFLTNNSQTLLTTQDGEGYTFNLIDMLGLLIQKTGVN
jgi:hypothetical protein